MSLNNNQSQENPEIPQNNNSKNSGISEVQKFKHLVAEILQKDENNTTRINYNGDRYIGTIIHKLLRQKMIKNFLHESNFSFFNSYKDDFGNVDSSENSRLDRKMEKYFPIHQEIFFTFLNQEIAENLKKCEEENFSASEKTKSIHNVILNFLQKYAYILVIFTEKIKLTELETHLGKSLQEIFFMYDGARMDMERLEIFDAELNGRITQVLSTRNEKMGDTTQKLLSSTFFSSLYRTVNRNVTPETQTNNLGKASKISEGIKHEYGLAVKDLFYIFEMWVEDGYDIHSERFKEIKIMARKLMEGMEFMKQKHMAFSDFPHKSISSGNNTNKKAFIDRFIKIFLSDVQSDVIEDFSTMLLAIFIDDKEKKDNLYQEVVNDLKTKRKSLLESRLPKKLYKHETIDIENIGFDAWQDVPEGQKYEYVFSQVIANNGKMQFNNFLHLNSDKKDHYLDVFTRYFMDIIGRDNYDKFRQALDSQISEILSFEGKTVQEFIQSDVNNLNFLILWWRFSLKVRTLAEQGKELNYENIKNIPERPYGIKEKIAEKLFEKGVLPNSQKVSFDESLKPKNTTVKSIENLLYDMIKGLRKGFIDLKSQKISLTNDTQKSLADMEELYLPGDIISSKLPPEEQIQQIERNLDEHINLCFDILKFKNISKIPSRRMGYYDILKDLNLVPKDAKILSSEDLVRVQELVEMLKYIRTRIRHLSQMLQIAEEDRKKLMKDVDIKKFLGEKDSEFGPAKTPGRAFQKLIYEYGGNFNKLGDLVRLRIVGSDLNDLMKKVVDFVEVTEKKDNITHISVIDTIGEPISIPSKKSGYRDIKVRLKLDTGSTVEVQFQLQDMFNVKNQGVDIVKNPNIFEKMKKENALFSTNEMQKILDTASEHNMQLPTKEILSGLLLPGENIDWQKYKHFCTISKVSSDDTYNIIRHFDRKSDIVGKITRLERALADSAWSKEVLRYLHSQKVQLQ